MIESSAILHDSLGHGRAQAVALRQGAFSLPRFVYAARGRKSDRLYRLRCFLDRRAALAACET